MLSRDFKKNINVLDSLFLTGDRITRSSLKSMKALVAVLTVFIGCMTNVILLEVLVKEDPGCGNLITFSQFIFIALEGFIFTSKFGTAKRHLQRRVYIKLVILFFIVNLCNNYAFDFNVPVPLHIILRSGSLIVNMVMGVIILKKSYKLSKYLSVLLITFGILLCTFISGKNVKSTRTRGPTTTPVEDFFWWTIGVIILVFALLLSALLGIYQESIFKQYGKHPREALFYTHFLPLPLFLFIYNNIYEHLLIALESEPLSVLNLFNVPKLIVYLIGNVLTQYMCIFSVFILTTESSSLVVTLVLTLRKFASLIFSVLYFKNPFTVEHWIGTFSVFIGTVIFTELHEKFYNYIFTRRGAKKVD